jgi:hypothetical protein
MAWGEDGYSLFITASSGLYKIRLNVKGVTPGVESGKLSVSLK